MRRPWKQWSFIAGCVALAAAVAMLGAGSTLALLSSSEAQGANNLVGATFSPSTAPVPTAANQTPSSSSVVLTWGAVTLSDTSNSGSVEYTVVRSPGNTPVCTLIPTTSCTDSSGIAGTNYTYTEESFYVVGSSSTWSLGPSAASNQVTFPGAPNFTTTLMQPSPTTVGSSWSDFATVTGNAEGGAPTGTVSFTFCAETTPGTPCTGGTQVGTVTAPSTNGDVATFTPVNDTETPTVGTYCYNASYTATAGGNYTSVSAQSDTECFTVTPAAPSSFTTNLSQPSSNTVGNSWNDSATVTGNSTGGAPTGSVAFSVCLESTIGTPCTSGGTTVGTVTPATSTSGDASTFALPAAAAYTPPSAGTYCYNASYGADAGGNYTSVAAQSDTECFSVTIAQAAPTSGSTTTASPFSSQLNVTGNRGSVTYTQSSGSPNVTVSSSGAVSAPATLAAGTYTATGTDADTSGDTGTWSFTLTVNATTITQTAPTTGSTKSGTAFSGQLAVSGSHGTVTYTQTTGSPNVTVSSSGAVAAPATLTAGTYTASGTDLDSFGDTGTWSFALTVTIAQAAPTSGSTNTGSAFSSQLAVSGNHGTVTYTQSSGSPNVTVSSSGAVSAPATLAAGTYIATGTDADTSGDTGTWSFTLTVNATTITQAAPTTGSTSSGTAFGGQLAVSGSHGTVTYTQTSGTPNLTVGSSGSVSAPSTLAAGTYTASGTDADTFGDSGTWSFTLTVTIAQAAPTSGSTNTASSFSGQLNVSGNRGSVTYTQSSGSPNVTVSSSGAVSAPATLAAGTYIATGTDADTSGNTGTWSFTLTVNATTITQAAPLSGSTTTATAFSGQLAVSGSHGTVTYTQSSGSPNVTVSSSGAVTAPATLTAGTYTAGGTDADTFGDSGSWTFSVTVNPTTITQAAPTDGTTSSGIAFNSQLAVIGSHGTVTYSQSSGSPSVTVSSSGAVTAPSTLSAGTYTASGTDSDTFGDSGTWSFTLTVNTAIITGITSVSGAQGNVKVEFTGSATPGGSVIVTVCAVSTFPCTGANIAGTTTAVTVGANGVWSTLQDNNNLGSSQYWAQAVETSPAAMSSVFGPFTPEKTSPTTTISTPSATVCYYNTVSGNCTTTPKSSWSTEGSAISGTASPSGVSLATVQVAIENPNGSWWNGSSFSSPTPVYNRATGTTAWSYAFTAAQLGSTTGSFTVQVTATDTDNITGPDPATSETFTWKD